MKNLRILVVEDHDDLAFAIQEKLESAGYEVKRANGSEEGYSTFLGFRPDLIITETMIGEEDGLKLISLIRNFAPNIRTIYICHDLNRYGSVLKKEQRRHRVSVLEKPFAETELMRLVYAQEYGWGEKAA
jgi:DNA-binding response OmpR family regulator